MQDLIELVSLLNKTKLKSSGVLNTLIEPQSKMEMLYEAIAQRKVASDEDIRALFLELGEDVSSVPSMKNKLKDRLLDSVFLLDFKESNFSTRQKAFFECYKKWSGAMILLIRNARTIGMDILENLLRHAIRFEFTELTLDILRVLRLQYSTVEGDMKKYEQVKEQYRRYEKIWLMEGRAEDYYAELMVQYTNSKATRTDHQLKAQEYYEELRPFMQDCSSFKLHLFGRLIHMMQYSIVNDYQSMAELCEDAIHFFDQKDYDSGLPLQVFYYNLIVSYLQLREFDKGQVIVEKSEKLFDEGTFNWFKLQELFFLLAMHTQHYQNAYHIYMRVTEHPRFKSQLPQIIEMWKIFQAYLYYLIRVGKVEQNPDDAQASKFKINKFMNEIPLFSKDKRGMNISILIIQILYSLSEKKYDETLARIEGIEKYCSRYLKENDTFRSNCFIKMLLQLPLASFHREAVARKTDKLFKMLREVSLEVANQTHEIEIIPYEHLWEMTIGSLELKIQKVKGSSTQRRAE